MIRRLLNGLFVSSWLLAGCAHAVTVEVFTHHPSQVKKISGHQVQVYDLSAPDRVKSPQFSSSPARAEKEAKAWLQSQAGQRHIEQLKAAHQGHTKAIKYQLMKVPAVVFEHGKYVVYGTTDVRKALQNYHQRGNHK